ncbi:MAG: hypothetical protein U0625_09910 [Phycisphaerales bacterium]
MRRTHAVTMAAAVALASACVALAVMADDPPAAAPESAPTAPAPAPTAPTAPPVATTPARALPTVAVVGEDGPGSFTFFTETRTPGAVAASVADALRGAVLPMQFARVISRPDQADWIVRVRVTDAGAGQEDVEVRASGYKGRRVGVQLKGSWTLLRRGGEELAAQGNFELGRACDAASPAGAQIATPGSALAAVATAAADDLAPRIADHIAPLSIAAADAASVRLNAGRARGLAVGDAFSVVDAQGRELAVLEVTSLSDAEAKARVSAGDAAALRAGQALRRIETAPPTPPAPGAPAARPGQPR